MRESAAAQLLTVRGTTLAPADFLATAGEVFTVFDRQDSANVSYGVRAGARRLFVKTAGAPDAPAFLPHSERVALLENAVRVAGAVQDAALPRLRNRIASPHGPLLVYDWAAGDLLGVPRAARDDPAFPFARFKALPLQEIVDALATVFRVHDAFAARGWCGGDFYDGCLIYDFARREIHVIDLDNYHAGPYRNQMGRMFGSERFMAPEEFELGAEINTSTMVFNLGRCLTVFLHDRCEREPSRRSDAILDIERRACAPRPEDRFASVRALRRAWDRDVVTGAKS